MVERQESRDQGHMTDESKWRETKLAEQGADHMIPILFI
jgi:hypothetical protein